MVGTLGLDVAWDRPTVAQILATGAHWVARYFSPDPKKNLKAAEVVSYPAAGLAIVTVYESTAARATQGRAAGVADAQAAEQQRKAVGLPADHVHHFAVDSDVTWAAVAPYFAGVLSVLPLGRVGCYGGYQVIAGAHSAGIRYLWQTVAWSQGRWHPAATIRQPGGTLLGGAADIDYAEVADFGQTPRPLEPDMPLSPADLAAVRTVVDASIEAHRQEAVSDVLYWFAAAAAGKAPAGARPVDVASVAAIHAALSQPAVQLTPEQVAGVAAALGPALADLLAKRLAS